MSTKRAIAYVIEGSTALNVVEVDNLRINVVKNAIHAEWTKELDHCSAASLIFKGTASFPDDDDDFNLQDETPVKSNALSLPSEILVKDDDTAERVLLVKFPPRSLVVPPTSSQNPPQSAVPSPDPQTTPTRPWSLLSPIQRLSSPFWEDSER
jgi:hypothetical protein